MKSSKTKTTFPIKIKSKSKKEQAMLDWQSLEKWVITKGQRVVIILEGDQNKTSKQFIKNLQNWSADKKTVRRVKLKNISSENAASYFEPLISKLPKAGQVTIFENCWYQKSMEKTDLGKWDTNLWISFSEKENVLQQANYIIFKYALKNQNKKDAGVNPIFEILNKTENSNNPFSYFNCSEKKSESYTLVQHLVNQIPHQDLTFQHKSIDFETLQQRAYNLRWATVSKDIIPLTAADPDFPVAPEIEKAINDYSAKRIFSYGPPTGLPAFRKAASKMLKKRKNLDCPSSCILPTDGAASAMYTIAKFALRPGDEAIIFDPVDFLFQKSIEAAGGKVVRIPMDPKTGTFDPKQFVDAISKKTKLIGLCNPHNPMGRVMSRQELLFIGSMAAKHKLWIMNDEVWSDIIYGERQHINIATLHPEIAQQTISVYGLSKTFGLAGLRVGFIAAPSKKVFDQILNISQANTTAGGVSTLSQVAATAAYQEAWYYADAFVEHLAKVRDYAVERLNNIPGVHCRKPEGTYLLFPNIQSFGMPSEKLAEYLFEHAKVAVVPGAAKWFGPGAEGHIRICFATSMEIIKEALDRIEKALAKLSRERQSKMEEIYFKNFDPKKVIFQ